MAWPFRRSARRQDVDRRRVYIEGYSFPQALAERIRERSETELSSSQLSLVFEGLRTWFISCLYADGKTLGMPSQVVDLAWHEFILMTRDYEAFCEEAFGYYLHHSPEETMEEPMPDALRRTLAVSERYPGAVGIAGVPLLFALDSELGYAGGTTWSQQELVDLRDRDSAGGDGGGYVGGGEAGWYGGVDGGGEGASCGGGGGCGGGS